MNDSLRLGLTTSVLGVIAGISMQSAADPMIQTIGGGWILGGVAATALLSGLSLVAAKWRSYKEEEALNQAIETFQHRVNTRASIHRVDQMTPYVELVRASAMLFDDSSDAKRESVVVRLQALGASLVDNMPTPKLSDSATELVNRSMGYIRFKLDQPLYSDAPVKNSAIGLEALNNSPSTG